MNDTLPHPAESHRHADYDRQLRSMSRWVLEAAGSLTDMDTAAQMQRFLHGLGHEHAFEEDLPHPEADNPPIHSPREVA